MNCKKCVIAPSGSCVFKMCVKSVCVCEGERESKTMKQRLCAITSVTGCLPCSV